MKGEFINLRVKVDHNKFTNKFRIWYDKKEAEELNALRALKAYGISSPGTEVSERTWMALKPMVKGVKSLNEVRKIDE